MVKSRDVRHWRMVEPMSRVGENRRLPASSDARAR